MRDVVAVGFINPIRLAGFLAPANFQRRVDPAGNELCVTAAPQSDFLETALEMGIDMLEL